MHHTERSELLLSPLQSGDEVAVVAASSALDNTDNLLRGISILDSWGLRIRPDVISQRRWGYLAGRDDERRSDFQSVPNALPLGLCTRWLGRCQAVGTPFRLAARMVAGLLGRDRTALRSHGSRCKRWGPWALNHDPRR